MISAVLLACGGFLLAVLWFDLMFDVQVIGSAPVPAEAVASIAGYYRRVTSDASPMGYLVGAVMLTAVVGATLDLVRDRARRRARLLALVLAVAPITLALVRVFPNAVALGSGHGAAAVQIQLAQAILWDHVLCFASIAGFLVVELVTVATSARAARSGGE